MRAGLIAGGVYGHRFVEKGLRCEDGRLPVRFIYHAGLRGRSCHYGTYSSITRAALVIYAGWTEM